MAEQRYCACLFIESYRPKPSVNIPIKKNDIEKRKKIILEKVAKDIDLEQGQIEFYEQSNGDDCMLLHCIVPQEYFEKFWEAINRYKRSLCCIILKTNMQALQQEKKILEQKEKNKHIISVGDRVKILAGEWSGFIGHVLDIKDGLYNVRITVFANVFQSIELTSDQITKEIS